MLPGLQRLTDNRRSDLLSDKNKLGDFSSVEFREKIAALIKTLFFCVYMTGLRSVVRYKADCFFY
ncbi:hypothetical protein M2277_003499 [Paenibacillus sp. LBL]|nr:hypothetical protein [Paenibacillus sp. LBL]